MASDWVTTRNHPRNRRISPNVVGKYLGDMIASPSRWREASPEGLIFDTEGKIISGQHRLRAQANSGKTLKWWIFPNQPRSLFQVVDQGYKRQAAHVIGGANPTVVAAAARYIAALGDRTRFALPRFPRVTTQEVVDTLRTYPELDWYSKDAHNVRLAARVPSGPHDAVLAMAATTAHRDKIPSWIDGLITGIDLSTGDPRRHLRNRFMSGQRLSRAVGGRDYVYALIAKSWNAHAAGEEIFNLRHAMTEPLPTVVGFELRDGQ
jgi:hypothetical protein